MLIFLLTIIIGLLGYLNYQIYIAWTGPRLRHEAMEMSKILKQWEQINKDKEINLPPRQAF